MKPLFKWSGGKTRELKRIKNYLPKNYKTYYEPFLGGGAMWLDLLSSGNHTFVVGDSFLSITNFFSVLKSEPKRLIDTLNNISVQYNNSPKISKPEMIELGKKFYYHYRDKTFNTSFEQAVQFYMLRQLSFSGMLRFSKDGNFNVPYGWYKTIKTLPKVDEKLLANSTIIHGDWKEIVKASTPDDFVFLDPPYTRRFTKYHPNGSFGQKEHKELCDWFKQKRAKALIVINKDDFTYELYKDYIAEEYGKKYSIQYKDRMKEKDSNAIHFIAKNY